MTTALIILLAAIGGFVVGALVFRKHGDKI